MRILFLVVLLLPQLAAAGVYMCVDEATGKTSFSDKGCAPSAAQQEVLVGATNVFSGSRTADAPKPKTWVSDRETRKTGRDLVLQKGVPPQDIPQQDIPQQDKATASIAATSTDDDS
jgi:hypothetical protein